MSHFLRALRARKGIGGVDASGEIIPLAEFRQMSKREMKGEHAHHFALNRDKDRKAHELELAKVKEQIHSQKAEAEAKFKVDVKSNFKEQLNEIKQLLDAIREEEHGIGAELGIGAPDSVSSAGFSIGNAPGEEYEVPPPGLDRQAGRERERHLFEDSIREKIEGGTILQQDLLQWVMNTINFRDSDYKNRDKLGRTINFVETIVNVGNDLKVGDSVAFRKREKTALSDTDVSDLSKVLNNNLSVPVTISKGAHMTALYGDFDRLIAQNEHLTNIQAQAVERDHERELAISNYMRKGGRVQEENERRINKIAEEMNERGLIEGEAAVIKKRQTQAEEEYRAQIQAERDETMAELERARAAPRRLGGKVLELEEFDL